MAIFKKQEPQKPRDRPAAPPRPNPSDGAISIVGAGMKIIGDVTTEGTIRIEGVVEGTIRAGTAVVLGQGGVVEGDVVTQDAVIGGTVRGSIVAGNRLELQSTSSVTGKIRARSEHLKLEEGARFAGQVQMMEDGEIDEYSMAEDEETPPGQDRARQGRKGSSKAKAESPEEAVSFDAESFEHDEEPRLEAPESDSPTPEDVAVDETAAEPETERHGSHAGA
jgi:cytoskeletal protein CcmA (bactofilin family)